MNRPVERYNLCFLSPPANSHPKKRMLASDDFDMKGLETPTFISSHPEDTIFSCLIIIILKSNLLI
jgi:hypothetical protein